MPALHMIKPTPRRPRPATERAVTFLVEPGDVHPPRAGELWTEGIRRPATGAPISVVISTLNRPRQLARCLDALLDGSRLPAEIVVVDQGDHAETARVLDARGPLGVPLIHVPQSRRGLSGSQNAGVDRASSRTVAIIDDDCVPDEKWLAVSERVHGEVSGPLLLGGRVLPLPPEGDRTVPLATRTSTQKAAFDRDAFPWDVGTGGNFSVTRAAYLDVGGNDERLGTGAPGRAGNDLDLFRRLMKAGVEARYDPDLLVHHERATAKEFRNRCWTYGFGIGACVALWLRSGDRWAVRVLRAWLLMRLRLIFVSRSLGASVNELRVILGTVHGLWHGSWLVPPPASVTREGKGPGPRDAPSAQPTTWPGTGALHPGRSAFPRLVRAARDPAGSVTRLWNRLAEGPGLPLGRTADRRHLLRRVLAGQPRALVIGPPGAARQALPETTLDVVGTDPDDMTVSVVSEARGERSLPERWDCVIVMEEEPSADVLRAAVSACKPGGMIAVVSRIAVALSTLPHAEEQVVLSRRSSHLALARVTG